MARDKAIGDVAIYGLWEKGNTCMLDIRITDMDAKSYASSLSAKVLEKSTKFKKGKYEAVCIAR